MLKSFFLGFLGLVKHGGWALPLKHFLAKKPLVS
ncbi:Uncharacterised protein [Escherichia coli]|nr:Uncharacterised protein [Escherichia coli]